MQRNTSSRRALWGIGLGATLTVPLNLQQLSRRHVPCSVDLNEFRTKAVLLPLPCPRRSAVRTDTRGGYGELLEAGISLADCLRGRCVLGSLLGLVGAHSGVPGLLVALPKIRERHPARRLPLRPALGLCLEICFCLLRLLFAIGSLRRLFFPEILRDHLVALGLSRRDGLFQRCLYLLGIEPGVVVGEYELLICVTEVTTQADIDRLVVVVAAVLNTSAVNTEEKSA